MRTLLRSIYRHVPASRAVFRKISQILPLLIRDRAFLEKQVFAYLNREQNIQKILFAGVEMYTLHYAGCLPGKQFQTIDIDPEKAGYGATNHHTVGSVTELRSYYKSDQFDCIILNGLIGYGLNSERDVDQALRESLARMASLRLARASMSLSSPLTQRRSTCDIRSRSVATLYSDCRRACTTSNCC